jgi:hypothetical protein
MMQTYGSAANKIMEGIGRGRLFIGALKLTSIARDNSL